jgi:urea transport system ATP-binding protein
MTTPVLRVKSLDSGYAEATVLHAVDFELQQGEIFGLLGKNGMGKSTLLKCIMGFLPKTAGQVELDGLDISGLPPHLIARAGIGYVAQEKALFQDLTVEENIRIGVRDRPIGVALGEIEASFPFLLKRLGQRAGTLSGGEQKMLLIARSVANGSRLLLIDEISEGLQPTMIERVASILINLVEQKKTAVLLVEQNIAFATQVAVRYAVLERGEIVSRGYANDPSAAGNIAGYFSV